MRGSKTLGIAALVAALGCGMPAHAQESTAAHNCYAGFTLGQAHWRPGCANGAVCDDTNTALRVFAGFQLNRIFSVEAGYHNLGKATSPGASIEGRAWEAVGVAA